MTTADASDFLAELISQLFHADVLITELAERIDALESEIVRLKVHRANGVGGVSRHPTG